MKEYIDDRITEYMNDDDESDETFFKMALVYQLGRIADALEDELTVRGAVDTYEQNIL